MIGKDRSLYSAATRRKHRSHYGGHGIPGTGDIVDGTGHGWDAEMPTTPALHDNTSFSQCQKQNLATETNASRFHPVRVVGADEVPQGVL